VTHRFNLFVINSLWKILSGERLRHEDPQLKDFAENLGEEHDWTKLGIIEILFLLSIFVIFVNCKTLFDEHNHYY
jgi:hypothetical protein